MAAARTSDSQTNLAYRADELPSLCGGRLLGSDTVVITRFEIDSRLCGPGALFVALAGERQNGHDFLGDAFARGANAALVTHEFVFEQPEIVARILGHPENATALIAVDDPLRALQELARRRLSEFRDLVRIAVTGSNGKTTTKELIAGVLAHAAPTYRSGGNFNSEIGVPLSVFEVTTEHRYAVFECAMNHPGEIGLLADIVHPEIALITNIAPAHIGFLGSLEAIAAEKKAIFSNFTGEQHAFVLDGDRFEPYLTEGVNGKVERFGERSTPGYEGCELNGLLGSTIRWRGRAIRVRLPGFHNVRNALAAISVALKLGCSNDAIVRGIEETAALFGRGELITVRREDGTITVLQDCYNANQHSVEAAIELLDDTEWDGRKILVLGAIKELGEFAGEQHRGVLERARASSADAVYLLGEEFVAAFEACSFEAEPSGTAPREGGLRQQLVAETEFEEVVQRLHADLRAGDLVLLKGSRGMALERVTARLEAGRV